MPRIVTNNGYYYANAKYSTQFIYYEKQSSNSVLLTANDSNNNGSKIKLKFTQYDHYLNDNYYYLSMYVYYNSKGKLAVAGGDERGDLNPDQRNPTQISIETGATLQNSIKQDFGRQQIWQPHILTVLLTDTSFNWEDFTSQQQAIITSDVTDSAEGTRTIQFQILNYTIIKHVCKLPFYDQNDAIKFFNKCSSDLQNRRWMYKDLPTSQATYNITSNKYSKKCEQWQINTMHRDPGQDWYDFINVPQQI